MMDSRMSLDLPDDFIRVEARIDGGVYQTVIEFRLDQAEPDNFNGIFREDTDGDGRGDGLALMNGAETFTKAITGTGSTLDLRLSVDVNAGDEDFGVHRWNVDRSPGRLVVVDVGQRLALCVAVLLDE